MKNNCFKLMATLLLCASTHQLVSEQSINQSNQITVNDLKNDLAYIDDFLTTVYGMKSILLPEEIELINHDLLHIEKYLSGYHDRSDVLQILNIVNQKFAKAQKYEQDLKDLERPKESTEIKLLPEKMSTVITKEQAAPVLTKKEGKKEDKTAELKKEFGMFFPPSSSSSHQLIEQPNTSKSENASPNTKTKNTHLFIENLTNKTLIVRYTPINGQVVRTQEIAPGQKSSPIDRSNIQNLFYHCRGASSTNAIDRTMIQRSRTIQVKSKKSPFSFFTGDSFTVEQREPARD